MKRLMMIWLMAISITFVPCVYTNIIDEQDEALAFEAAEIHNLVRRKKHSKELCNLVAKCLSAGMLRVDNNLVIEGNLTVNSINPTINEDHCIIPTGLNGQVLIGITGEEPVFNFITSSNNTVIFTPGPGSLGLQSEMFFGNIARVDQIYGNDTGPDAGAVNGLPFLTMSAALTAAGAYNLSTGDPVVVWVFPGIYNETISIPNNVSVVGISSGASPDVGGVTIQGITADTTLVSMGSNSLLANVNVSLNSSGTLVGIAVPAGPATINRVIVNVSGGTSNTGILPSGTTTIDSSTINSIGSGFGINVNAAATVTMSNSTVTSSGGVGVETNNGGASFTASASTISGATADIFQNSGTITIGGCTLAHENANNVGFASSFSPNILNWAVYNIGGAFVSTGPGTQYLQPGTSTNADLATTPNNFGYIVPQQCLARNLTAMTYNGGPGVQTTTFTLYKNGAATALSTTLTGSGIQTASDTAHSVLCNQDDILTMGMINPTGSTLVNPSSCVSLY